MRTISRAPTSRGDLGYSSCTMYNVSLYPPGTDPAQLVFGENDTIPCQYGYWYDRQYYDKIPATQQNWVCEKELYATNVFAVIRMAEVLGSFALGQLGDRIGRLPVFLVSIVMILVGRSFAVMTDEIYWLFALLAFIGSFGTNTSFQSPLIVVMEISRDEDRAALSLWQLVGWTLGVSLPPLAFWWLRDWVWFMLLTSIPCALFILIPGYTIESPRWLATQGLYKKCLTELKKIAKVNARQFLLTEDELRERVPVKEVEKTYGIASLFSGWHMTKLSGLLLFSWICNTIPTYTLLLFSMQMGGNPFLNVFWQGAIELPAYFCGQMLCNSIGRRITNCIAFMGIALACIPIILIIQNSETEIYVTTLAVIVKFFVCLSYFALYLQSYEVYPITLRQTGTSFGLIISNIFGTLGPYIVYLGTNNDVRLPFAAMGLIGLVGCFASSCLPETLYQKLPETMQEGRLFGKGQKFWSLPQKPRAEQPQQPATNRDYSKLSQHESVPESQSDSEIAA
ncbi:carcinine transporter-like isoform X2 [Uranotaenia lowii]|uniref:carcinine transporter-like isoform X2 n=1 Tax=Uranotaenia lowii TaxID=190385 RepID=UPI002479A83F|nr:carcinine transporter-like isoform X2 [Uranotaenia lowii]